MRYTKINGLPHFIEGIVVHGFGRGGKQLGCPTANLDEVAVAQLPENFPCGVYYGLAQVGDGGLYRMVMSVGWNPHFHNEKKTMEIHILCNFTNDFYDNSIRAVALGFIREMESFNSLDDLMNAIRNDISIANRKLDMIDMKEYEELDFFRLQA
ncbi:hypothetical protein L596_004533 [Steinernema carpocapsae]|uniref:riboflavin kinase n=1 Tax=Steinernema carpocapsae TaxID=34508 RepID=A0A4U8UW36_STECR|nr:hypothetical protein L596_004533 [Steinernema carpocapsae]